MDPFQNAFDYLTLKEQSGDSKCFRFMFDHVEFYFFPIIL